MQTFKNISKDLFFIQIADAVSVRATCLRRRYGAVIVSEDGRIVSTGYNGAPRTRKHCTDLGICLREAKHIPSGKQYELCRSVHAEANAIINGNPLDIKNGTLYLAGTDVATNKPTASIYPCAMCQRMILNAKIHRVVLRREDGNLLIINPLDFPDDAPEENKQDPLLWV